MKTVGPIFKCTENTVLYQIYQKKSSFWIQSNYRKDQNCYDSGNQVFWLFVRYNDTVRHCWLELYLQAKKWIEFWTSTNISVFMQKLTSISKSESYIFCLYVGDMADVWNHYYSYQIHYVIQNNELFTKNSLSWILSHNELNRMSLFWIKSHP